MLLNCSVGKDSWESLGLQTAHETSVHEIQAVHPKGNQSWIFTGRTDAEAETPILWPADTKNWLTGKHPYAGKDWRQEKGMTENEMVGWTRWLTRWTWVWESSGSWWWTRKPGVLQSMGSQRVGHDWATELNWDLSAVPLPWEPVGRWVVSAADFNCCLNTCSVMDMVLLLISYL